MITFSNVGAEEGKTPLEEGGAKQLSAPGDLTVAAPRENTDVAQAAELLVAVVAHFSGSRQDSPGHVHAVKDRWDHDGSICFWCATWRRIREVVARLEAERR